ncbi:YihY/virulence factor BrkB family protein [Nocardioides guangzhouensis]|uniref:YihY/virulence factor BrkB family protein n=1 Tax=Nocardioides guangzhouensis TaxID=2497878 RepID=A0A4Q4Z7B1_9ACTN|nr:YihY/virulence factor BrkB family protein [Nocardioides guangzhouensis]RYP83642.1 YihY/virulence factor BrkB family protein [Nocardioides guangzhouensis]
MDETGITDLTARSWKYVVRKTTREFLRDRCPDLAAALTYYGVLALFPAAIALLSVIGLVGNGRDAVDAVLGVLDDLQAGTVADTIEPTLVDLSRGPGAGWALVLGLGGALWSASGYVGAFGRAMNEMYDVREGRPFWKLRPLMVLLTALLVVLSAAILLGLVVSGPVADAIGSALGIGGTAVTLWGILKWPVLLVLVAVIIALLYWGTPNVRYPRFRWISPGAGVAIVAWVVGSAAFGLYVTYLGSFSHTYGRLAGAIVFLLWLWVTNLALLFGAELDAEIERGRELQAGLRAEESLQLEPRDASGIEKAEQREQDDVRSAREIREAHETAPDRHQDPEPREDQVSRTR